MSEYICEYYDEKTKECGNDLLDLDCHFSKDFKECKHAQLIERWLYENRKMEAYYE